MNINVVDTRHGMIKQQPRIKLIQANTLGDRAVGMSQDVTGIWMAVIFPADLCGDHLPFDDCPAWVCASGPRRE